MAKTTEIALSEPIVGPDGPVTKVVLREPRGRDFFELGEPIAFAQTREGMIYTADLGEVLRQYVERCALGDPLLLAQLSLADGMKLKQAVLDFFTAARALASPNSAISSSST